VFWDCFFGDPKSIKMIVGKLRSKNRFNNVVAIGFYKFSMLEERFLKPRHPKQNHYGATCLAQHGQRIQAPRQQERASSNPPWSLACKSQSTSKPTPAPLHSVGRNWTPFGDNSLTLFDYHDHVLRPHSTKESFCEFLTECPTCLVYVPGSQQAVFTPICPKIRFCIL
jgi:hypothetical protein